MHLFDSYTRVDDTPKQHSERSFDFLNRSARREFHEVRNRLEMWFERYPAPHSGEFLHRLRSRNDAQHNAAVFELFLHELLTRLDFRPQVHPSLALTAKTPDFLARLPGGDAVVLEATEVRPRSGPFADRPLEAEVYDAINALPSSDFFLAIQPRGELRSAPRRSSILKPLAEFMAQHDPDEVEKRVLEEGERARPFVEVTHEDWTLRATLFAKHGLRGDPSTRTMAYGPSFAWGSHRKNLRDAVRAKARKFASCGLPLVVAVNAPDVDEEDEERALFGKTDSVWFDRASLPRHTRLSGVLVFRGVSPWWVTGVPTCLYINPSAQLEVPEELIRLRHATHSEGVTTRWSGADIGVILGVAPIGG